MYSPCVVCCSVLPVSFPPLQPASWVSPFSNAFVSESSVPHLLLYSRLILCSSSISFLAVDPRPTIHHSGPLRTTCEKGSAFNWFVQISSNRPWIAIGPTFAAMIHDQLQLELGAIYRPVRFETETLACADSDCIRKVQRYNASGLGTRAFVGVSINSQLLTWSKADTTLCRGRRRS